MTKHDVHEASAVDIPFLGDLFARSGMFSQEEVGALAGMLPEQLADPAHVWLRSAGGAAYMTLDGLSRDVWNLWFLGTLPVARRQGQGNALLHAAEHGARDRGGRLMLIETSSGDAFDPARALYARRGYTAQGRIADYYAPGEAKVIMARAL